MYDPITKTVIIDGGLVWVFQDAPDPSCAAAIVSLFSDKWASMSFALMIDNLLRTWKRTRLLNNRDWLIKQGILLKRHNPITVKFGDRELQYKIDNEQLQNCYHCSPEPLLMPIDKTGYIYLTRAILPINYYKIGCSKNPVRRIKSIGVQLPFPIEAIHQFPTDDMEIAERYFHGLFSDKRKGGEWFVLTDDDVEMICSIKSANSEDLK